MKGVNIIQGWSRSLGIIEATQEEKEMSAKRLKQCESCPLAKPSKILRLIKGNEHHLDDFYCSGCGCPVVEKSLVTNEKCPEGKW